MGCAASTSTPTSTSLSSDTIGASTGTSRSRPCSGSHRTITRRATGISLAATILAKVCRQSDASRDAEGQRQACSRMVQASLKIPAPAPLRVRLSSNAKCGTTWDNGISLFRDDIQIPQLAKEISGFFKNEHKPLYSAKSVNVEVDCHFLDSPDDFPANTTIRGDDVLMAELFGANRD